MGATAALVENQSENPLLPETSSSRYWYSECVASVFALIRSRTEAMLVLEQLAAKGDHW